MKLSLFLFLLLGMAAHAAEPAEFAAGRTSYRDGEFRQAIAHFQRVLHDDPRDAASHYWIGRSYVTLADIATPFGGRYRPLARVHLTAAAELAPDQPEYRRELFDFLLDSGGFSRSEQRQAVAIILASAESGSDYQEMRARFEQAYRLKYSINGRLSNLFLAVPQAGLLIAAPAR